MEQVQFNFLDQVALRDRTALKRFISSIFKTEGRKLLTLNYVFCDDEYILQVNRQFLNHDYYTDIITFDLTDKTSASITAEIYISIDTVRSNSKLFNSSFVKELHRVIFHGVLHLCGYRDRTKMEKEEMRQKEDHYLQQYFG